uniref:Uncharacterized protein n=1 Tax=Leptobrachium leishanense TaxID=445787 RepID=A0A8C5MPX4_9ANUR
MGQPVLRDTRSSSNPERVATRPVPEKLAGAPGSVPFSSKSSAPWNAFAPKEGPKSRKMLRFRQFLVTSRCHGCSILALQMFWSYISHKAPLT